MTGNGLSVLAAFEMPLGEAAKIAVLGLLIVFVVLAVLVGILTLFKLVFNVKLPARKTEAQEKPQAAELAASGDDEEEIAAVIAAVIACLEGDESVKAPFVVKNIKKLK